MLKYTYKICQVWYAHAENYRMQNINQRSKQDGKPYWVHMLKGRERHQLPPCWSTRSNNSYQNPNKSLCIYNPQNSNTCVERQKTQCKQHPLKIRKKTRRSKLSDSKFQKYSNQVRGRGLGSLLSPGHVYSWPLVPRFPLLLRKPSVAMMHAGSPSHLQLSRIRSNYSLLLKKPLPNAHIANNQLLPPVTSCVWMSERGWRRCLFPAPWRLEPQLDDLLVWKHLTTVKGHPTTHTNGSTGPYNLSNVL